MGLSLSRDSLHLENKGMGVSREGGLCADQDVTRRYQLGT